MFTFTGFVPIFSSEASSEEDKSYFSNQKSGDEKI